MFILILCTLLQFTSSVPVNPNQMVPVGVSNNPVPPGRTGIDYAFDQWNEVPLGRGPFLKDVFNNVTGNYFVTHGIWNLTFYDMQVRSHLQSDYFDFSQSDPVALRQSSYPYSKNVGTRWFGHFGIRVNSFRAYVGKSDANNCTLIGLSRPKFDEAVNLNYLWIRYQDVSITNPFKSTSNEEWREELPKVVPRPLEFAVKLDPNCKLLSTPGYREMYEYAFNEMPQLQAELRSVLTNFMGEWYNNWVIQPYAAKNAKIN